MGEELSLIWIVPFAGILLSIGLFPLFAPHFWHRHFAKVSVGWALLFAIPFLAAYGGEAVHAILHIYLLDYLPFVILLWALFVVSGGILVKGTLVGRPSVNTAIILVGTMIASWIGTTGASMLLIRPLLRANENRRYRVHTVVFFIFLVSNIGGTLTPLGDPPLFLGFLHHVPFFWTLTNLWPHFFVAVLALTLMYFAIDSYWYSKESPEAKMKPLEIHPLRLVGKRNFVLLGGVIAGVLLSGYWKPQFNANLGPLHIRDGGLMILESHNQHAETARRDPAEEAVAIASQSKEIARAAAIPHHSSEAVLAEVHGSHRDGHEQEHHDLSIPVQNLTRDVILIGMGLLSLCLSPKGVREANEFSWFPILEVAWLFAGIFMTIIPALEILKAGENGALGFVVSAVQTPNHYFFVTGGLSSFLDNAPTYLTFLNTAQGRFHPNMPEAKAVELLIAEENNYLIAISIGAVFMGANTYIGNAPNFMVKSIAEESRVKMPDFFSYIFKYSLPYLIPVFVVVAWIFL